jgi:hypothetical protein
LDGLQTHQPDQTAMIEILLVIVAFAFGAVIGWFGRNFIDASRKRRELKAWLKCRRFFYPNIIKK